MPSGEAASIVRVPWGGTGFDDDPTVALPVWRYRYVPARAGDGPLPGRFGDPFTAGSVVAAGAAEEGGAWLTAPAGELDEVEVGPVVGGVVEVEPVELAADVPAATPAEWCDVPAHPVAKTTKPMNHRE